MSRPSPSRAVAEPIGSRPAGGRARRRLLALAAAVAVLALLSVASILLGSALLSPGEVWHALTTPDGSVNRSTVVGLRVPRTELGVIVGAALGVAGALMQGLTRNPLADPGILGVNAGAGFAVALGVVAFGVTRIQQYLPFAFLGAIGAAVLVYAIAAGGRAGPTPLRLTLVGVALGAVLTGISRTLALLDEQTFDRMRFWNAGTIADRPAGTIGTIWPWVVAGLVLAALCLPALNTMALGDDVATSMGVPVPLVRAGVILSVTLLCGAATAAVGPIAFLGLMVPHAVRFVTGPDLRWVVAFTVVVAPALLLLADIVGRLIVYPAELQVGVVVSLIGAPVLVALVRRSRVVAS
ncbi:MAG: iron chelate uptake ABC transporter family permease subunit [Nocardioides sp.]|uniref:FecCD family ABC transporter permease n=1 Tax=Nocardioides sp. TaxID=35761 RepID=UPI0039E424E5